MFSVDESAPELVMARAGDGPWRAVSPAPDGRYTFQAEDDFEIVVACTNADDTFDVQRLAGTVDDGLTWLILSPASPAGPSGGCAPAAEPPPTTAKVTGQMVQAGTVFLSASQTSAVPDWDFSLDVPIGDHDLLARSSATDSRDKLVVRRNQLITAAVTEPTIDVAADGIALDQVDVDVSNAIPGTTDVSTWFDGAFIFEQQQANNASALPVKTEVVPASVLLPMEQQSVSFSTTDDSRANDLASQWCTESFTDTPAHIDLIPVPSVSFRDVSGAVTASWPNALPDDAEAVLSLSTSCTSLPCANQSSETAVVTSRWLALHGQTTLALGSYPDQLDPSQRVDLGAAHDEMFAIDEFGATATYETTVVHLDHSGAP